jgi:hypothetical protein
MDDVNIDGLVAIGAGGYGRQYLENHVRQKKESADFNRTAPLRRELSDCRSTINDQESEIKRLKDQVKNQLKEDDCDACGCNALVKVHRFRNGYGRWHEYDVCESCVDNEVLVNCFDCCNIMSKITDDFVEVDGEICHKDCVLECDDCEEVVVISSIQERYDGSKYDGAFCENCFYKEK